MPITWLLYKATSFKKRTIGYRRKRFRVDVASSFFQKALGLMHRKAIGRNEGMLFIFNKDGKYDIWMPNMNFSIDIIWLDSKSRVLKIVENAEPCRSIFACPAYVSPQSARYILEFRDGTARREGIRKGGSFILYPNKDF